MGLQVCQFHSPDYEIILDGLPRIETVEDVVYIPETPGTPQPDVWGIFRRDRRLVESTAFFRGPGPHLAYQRPTTEIECRDVKRHAPDECYIYGGRVIPHFGHFLLGALPRFWCRNAMREARHKILIHSMHDVETLFSHPHVADIFGAIGLSADDFVRFTEPVRVSRLIVPWPSFEEGHLAHPVFAEFCHEIGRVLIGPTAPVPDDRPVYFTKEHMRHGIGRFANEADLTKILAESGVDIVAPETLTTAEQVRLFANRSLVTGSFGSVFHTSIFVPRRRMMMLNWANAMFRNFTLVDAINGNDTQYVYPFEAIEFCGHIGEFGSNWRLLEPAATAQQFLTAMDVFSEGRGCADGLSRVLSVRKPTLQSSYHDPDRPVQGSGVEGRLTGGATFHTAYDDGPWWQVDLEQQATITNIVLFNVVGPPIVTLRAAQFRLLVSQDGSEWEEIFRRTDPEAFGGMDSTPFHWAASSRVVARYVRVQLLKPEFLHLDQVQVFGIPLAA